MSKYLNLVPTGRVVSRGIHATAIVNRYFVNIKLDDEVIIHDLKVVEANLEHGLDVLIGMDIIVKGDFLIRKGKMFSFGVPSFKNWINTIEYDVSKKRSSIDALQK